LAQAGYEVRSIPDPVEALELFCTHCPDVVVLAADLPLVSGQPLPALFASHGLRPGAPVVVIDKAHLGRARGRQAILGWKPNAYVEDPLKGDALRERLHALRDAPVAQPGPGVGQLLARTPVQAGPLKTADLPAQLCSLFRLRRHGVLVLAEGTAVCHVHLAEGAPVAFATNVPDQAWSAYFAERGRPAPPGDGPGGLGSFPPRDSVEGEAPDAPLWRDFVRLRVAEQVGRRRGHFGFYAGDQPTPHLPQAQVPALAPLLEGARKAFRVQRFGRVLKPHQGLFPVRTPSFAEDLRALGLDTADLKICMQVNGRLKLKELLAHGRGGLGQAYSLFWFLHLCGALHFAEAPLPITGPGETDTLPERRRKPLPPELATQLREGALRIITTSYFTVLGLDIAADGEAVERAYREVAARFHPDTHAEYDIRPLQDVLESVQDKLTAAYRVLSVDEKRRAYLQYLFSRSVPGRVSPVHIDAEVAVRRGEAHARRGDARSALMAFEEAVRLNPREPEYFAYLVWFTYQLGESQDRARVADKLLRRALGLFPHATRLQILRAILDSDQGEVSRARKRLLQVLEENPSSALAKAALRYIGR
jgi:tetratricopeptide (TPR) repeat protein